MRTERWWKSAPRGAQSEVEVMPMVIPPPISPAPPPKIAEKRKRIKTPPFVVRFEKPEAAMVPAESMAATLRTEPAFASS